MLFKMKVALSENAAGSNLTNSFECVRYMWENMMLLTTTYNSLPGCLTASPSWVFSGVVTHISACFLPL